MPTSPLLRSGPHTVFKVPVATSSYPQAPPPAGSSSDGPRKALSPLGDPQWQRRNSLLQDPTVRQPGPRSGRPQRSSGQ
ncbi:hypothetical protein NDU88_006892 [Pleurodeles waltl]|uniref:Uncharacterized protein n=1 Tax=Pleurodeles waltl TaxID=8319 RepID=A0AAV7PMQ1_PLEWA|nr:hypothetical protein NDU88_006892 [Pleurodeles waltl]